MMQLEGALAVKAAILNKRRVVHEIIIDEKKKDRDTAFIESVAKKHKLTINYKKRETIDELASGKTHGGIIAKTSFRSYQKLSEVFDETGFYCLLEGIEDPFNLGYCFRSLYAAGCRAVILPKRNWEKVEDIIVKSSAGASEYLAIVMSEDFEEEIRFFKEKEVPLISAHRKDAINLYEADLAQKLCICIGGEMRGLSRIVLDASSQRVFIPYGKDVKIALNASSATAVIAFEISRQRGKG